MQKKLLNICPWGVPAPTVLLGEVGSEACLSPSCLLGCSPTARDLARRLQVIGRVVGQQNVLSVQRLRPPADPLPVLGSVALPARRRTSVFSPHGRPDAEKSVSTEPSSGRGKSDFVVLLSSGCSPVCGWVEIDRTREIGSIILVAGRN